MQGRIGFFELGVEDPAKAQTFYSALFDWTFDPMPGGGAAIDTGSVPGGLHGGDPGAGPYVFFEVTDIDDAIARVRSLGGSIDDVDIEGDAESQATFGRFRLCRDDQGSPFGLHQPPAR